METQVILLGDVHFAVVFKVVNHKPEIIDKYSAEVIGDLREWLHQNGYPETGIRLQAHPDANLPHGYYIKPHMTDRYFRVHEDDVIEEVDADQIGEELNCPDMF